MKNAKLLSIRTTDNRASMKRQEKAVHREECLFRWFALINVCIAEKRPRVSARLAKFSGGFRWLALSPRRRVIEALTALRVSKFRSTLAIAIVGGGWKLLAVRKPPGREYRNLELGEHGYRLVEAKSSCKTGLQFAGCNSTLVKLLVRVLFIRYRKIWSIRISVIY